jgi:hypothetical protein
MNRSEQINELAAALAKAQGAIESAPKDSENPFFKSHYADLAAVWSVARKPLSDNGLSVTQHPAADGNLVTVETGLLHASGQWLSSQLTMTAKDASPQAIGSCITYARRYALASTLGIASEDDDDGNSAQPAKGQSPVAKPVNRIVAKTEEPAPKSKVATSTTRAYWLAKLGCQEEGPSKDNLTAYLRAAGWLDKDKAVEQWPVRTIPLTKEEGQALESCLEDFVVNGNVALPYQPHGMDPATIAPKLVEPPEEPAWKSFVIPLGPAKGQSLGSLSPEDLDSYCATFTVRAEVNGMAVPPDMVAIQKSLRAALDEAAKSLEKKG